MKSFFPTFPALVALFLLAGCSPPDEATMEMPAMEMPAEDAIGGGMPPEAMPPVAMPMEEPTPRELPATGAMDIPPPSPAPRTSGPGSGAADPSGGAGPAPSREFHTVDVFYATDRKPTGNRDPNNAYSGDRHREGPMQYGKTMVSIPFTHQIGQIERPRWYKLEFSEDPKRHVVILELDVLEADAYFSQVSQAATDRPKKEGLLFIHGFNVAFPDAVRRTAQIAFDLDFGGVPLLFSWPSQGALEAYTIDEDNAEWAIPHLSRYLVDLQENTGLEKIHVIAHSMGTRVLSYALANARDEGFDLELNNVILAAPDIDADVFKDQILPKMEGMAQRLTMYASSGDAALKISQRLNGNDRLGLSGEGIIRVFPGMDTVDASEIDTSMIGHGYYGSQRLVVEDILNLVIRGLDPPSRQLVPGKVGEWAFKLAEPPVQP